MSVAELVDELSREGFRTKIQQRISGPHKGGCAFRRGTLFHLLSNRVYRGMILYKKECFEGEHEAIVSNALWDEVQATLARRAHGPSRRLKAKHPSLLVGMLVDGEGRAMTTSHATKPGVRYRYYNTRSDLLDGSPAWRVSSHDLEQLVCNRIAELLADNQALRAMLGDRADDAQALQSIIEAGDVMAARSCGPVPSSLGCRLLSQPSTRWRCRARPLKSPLHHRGCYWLSDTQPNPVRICRPSF